MILRRRMREIFVRMREILATYAHEIKLPFIMQKTKAKTLKITFLDDAGGNNEIEVQSGYFSFIHVISLLQLVAKN